MQPDRIVIHARKFWRIREGQEPEMVTHADFRAGTAGRYFSNIDPAKVAAGVANRGGCY